MIQEERVLGPLWKSPSCIPRASFGGEAGLLSGSILRAARSPGDEPRNSKQCKQEVLSKDTNISRAKHREAPNGKIIQNPPIWRDDFSLPRFTLFPKNAACRPGERSPSGGILKAAHPRGISMHPLLPASSRAFPHLLQEARNACLTWRLHGRRLAVSFACLRPLPIRAHAHSPRLRLITHPDELSCFRVSPHMRRGKHAREHPGARYGEA